MNRRRASVTRNIKARIGVKIMGAIADRGISNGLIEGDRAESSIERLRKKNGPSDRSEIIGDLPVSTIGIAKIDIVHWLKNRCRQSR